MEDTARLAEALAGRLAAGDSVWLRGELGAGKTAFVRAAAAALGIEGAVTSPTYTVGNRYRGSGPDVSHLDLYRSTGLTEEEWGDLEPYFEDAVVFIEWPDAGARYLPAPTVRVDIEFVSADARLITVSSDDSGLVNALAPACP
ncbi:MAG TPA: tRNA (adenosine(37)-N6)-threonylcarbamoyltransferase complex ATPase subunit type 1 TsaE [Gaiellales bacterium]|nr:tRNA (adenosine(37)-N6)-threonylcarbamoyltransferase complex ATPase subunit type 1 TsaE [Gaiellales bacterium]